MVEETLETSDAKCPYCGHMQMDSWEWHLNDGESIDVECQSCEKTFTVTCDIQIWYRGTPKTGESNADEAANCEH
jgi:hypothetical protein